MNTNRLINEKSPYLLQHSHNPVDWFPWGEEAFKKAKSENKPIFLSVGYSTCYWCHVMERESFENEDIAALMNDYFVNIKVDREELPEIDRIYMNALQSMTGSGGWPMNMFLTPDLKPFYGATYIPPKAKYGKAGIEDILIQVNNLWKEKKQEILESSEKIFSILDSRAGKTTIIEDNILDAEVSHNCFETAKRTFDYENGGFGQGNKFPRTVLLNFLLQYYKNNDSKDALDMVTFTLLKMYRGGLFDHLEGGFHRYSVDSLWRVPHFEKMLYDQALITDTLLDTYLLTKNSIFTECAARTFDYTFNILQNPDGGFYSAEDAESYISEEKIEKAEGYFYMWTQEDVKALLTKEEYTLFNFVFGLMFDGNTINDPHNVFSNRNVLFIANDLFDAAKEFDKTPEKIKSILENAISKIKSARKKRLRPGLDDKILTSWNGLLIHSLAKAYQIMQDEVYLNNAKRTASSPKANAVA